ncbi:hypothetical protein ACWDWO_00610 [Actinopolymorpha singaporensis]|uniref:Uncharacterized protein n=1 Tax=Actinopolymorpha singaporensis TaxID=117157 RepID=A0A1H1LJ22_9ACTN|nr:hypothetical protein [Actinopolymorpha singaporensis]SDR74312.1 hypothetical protein SAMN04489717_0357 [Actinopolymorpha singaporensis]
MSGIVESHDKEYVLAWVRARMAPATVDGLSEAQDSEDSSAAADPASEPSGNGCDHHGENAMDDDEGKAREALAAGRTDEAIAHTLLDMRDTLHHMWWSTAQLNHSFNTWMRALADREGRAVTLIHRDSADPRTWHAQWNAGTSGGSKSWMGEGKEDAMRWAAELPAGVRLILDPDTNKWMPWEDADRYVERPF